MVEEDELDRQDQRRMAKVFDEDALSTKGHNIMAAKGATVVIDSTIIGSFHSIEKSDPQLADAVAQLVAFVENYGDQDSAKALSELVGELEGDQKPTRVRAFWDCLLYTSDAADE